MRHETGAKQVDAVAPLDLGRVEQQVEERVHAEDGEDEPRRDGHDREGGAEEQACRRARPAPWCTGAGRRCRPGRRGRPPPAAGSTAGRAAGSPGRGSEGRGDATTRGSRPPARRSGRACSALARSYFRRAGVSIAPSAAAEAARDPGGHHASSLPRHAAGRPRPPARARRRPRRRVGVLPSRPRAGGQRPGSPALPRPGPRFRDPRPRPRLADDRRGEGLPDDEPGRGHTAPRRAGVRVVERVPPRRGPRRGRHRLPAGHRPRRHLRRAARARDGGGHRRRGPGQAPPVRPPGPARPLPGPHLLVAQHQHLPRPPLGAGPGDVRGGPIPHRAAGRRVREGPAGRRPALPQGRRDREALRGPQRARARSPPLRRPPDRARPLGDVPARVPRPRAGGQGRFGDERLQPGERRLGHGQPAPAHRHPEDAVGVLRLRRVGLRGGGRHLHAPQDRGDRGGGLGARGHAGLRPRVRELLPLSRQGPRARPAEGRGPRRGGSSPDARAASARDVRPARAGEVRADPVLGERRARARPPRAARGAGVDRPPEERRDPAPAQGPPGDRGDRPERGRRHDAARQLQRDAVPTPSPSSPGIRGAVSPGTQVVYERGCDLVEGRQDPRAASAIDAAHLRPVAGLVRAGAPRRLLPRPGPRGRAGAHARGPEGGLPLGPRRAHGRARGPRRDPRRARPRRRRLLRPVDGRPRPPGLGRVRARRDRERRGAPLPGRAEGPRGVDRDGRDPGGGRPRAPGGRAGARREARVLRAPARRRGPSGVEAALHRDALRRRGERGARTRTSSSSWAASPPRSRARR